jgi:octaprenyl-diphosphate synthase
MNTVADLHVNSENKGNDRKSQPVQMPFGLISAEIENIDRLLLDHVKSFDPAVQGYVEYICKASGKHIRPALALLMGHATGKVTEKHETLSCVLELIHIASLVHDDIMDGANLRRNMPTASAKWGNSLSVLLGDSLFAYALELAAKLDDSDATRLIAKSARDVCCGEILQTQRRFDLSLNVQDYLKMIQMKTAALFATATELAGRFNEVSESEQKALFKYGNHLGMAYQIYDDCIDLIGNEALIGKTLGTDLVRGKLTLPMIYLLEGSTQLQRDKLSHLLLNAEPVPSSVLAGIADYEGSLDRAVVFAQGLLQEASESIAFLTPSVYQQALLEVTAYVNQLLEDCKVKVF